MKIIKYLFNGEPVEMECATQAVYDANYPIAEKEADTGTIDVSGEFDAEPMAEPTQLDRVEAQATYTAMMTDTLLEV